MTTAQKTHHGEAMAKSKAKTKKATEKTAKPEAAKAEPKEDPYKLETPKKPSVSDERGGFGVPSLEPVSKPEERKIQFTSLYRMPMDITLEHDVYCEAIGRCVCSTRTVVRWRRVEKGSKEQAPRYEDLKIPKSFRLVFGQTSESLHEAAKLCADVKSRSNCRPNHIKISPA